MSSISTEKLFAMYAHFHREAQHTPEITFSDEDEVRADKFNRKSLGDVLAENQKQISG
jgi:hypothetical protein